MSAEAKIRVLDALDVPRTTREIQERLLHDQWQAWADENGATLDDLKDGGTLYFPGRLLASIRARENGAPYLNSQAVYRALVQLEKAGLVSRMKPSDSSRAWLWFRPLSTTAEALA